MGRIIFWCTGNHWSGGTKYTGMYADHKTVIMTLGELAWMNAEKVKMVNRKRLRKI